MSLHAIREQGGGRVLLITRIDPKFSVTQFEKMVDKSN